MADESLIEKALLMTFARWPWIAGGIVAAGVAWLWID